MRRRTAITSMAMGSAVMLGSVAAGLVLPAAAQAADEPGSGLGSFNLAANAPLVQVRFNDGDKCAGTPGGTGGCEGVIPETVSTLRNGPIGYGLSSIAWPGVLAGNIGSVVIVAGGPDQASSLNSPVRAEARTGDSQDTVTNTDYPGAKMTVTAKDDVVSAAADIAADQNQQVGTFTHSSSRTKVQLTGPSSAIGEAYSHAQDISLAGGVVTIGSVTSTAKATTDGAKATASGSTLVNDVKIAGVPVTIDEKGVTVNGNNAPVNSVASAAVNQAMSAAGMTIAISQPAGKPQGGSVTYNAGSLVFAWKTPGGTVTAILGGATVQLAAVKGGDFSFGTGVTTPVGPAAPPALNGGSAPVPAGVGDAPAPAVGDAPAAPAVAAPAVRGLVQAARRLPLPAAPSPAYAVLGLVGAGLFAVGLRQLPDRVLESTAATCLLGETP